MTTKIIKDVKLGNNVILRDFINLYGCTIGDDSRIGTFVEIQKGVSIGSHCKISSHTFICEGVIIGNRVFIGHGVIFCNDKYPRATNSDGTLKTVSDWKCEEIIIEDDVSIGSGAIILPGIRIGKESMIGAGAVVTKDVEPGVTIIGHPGRSFGVPHR